jgi:hypothetical protein
MTEIVVSYCPEAVTEAFLSDLVTRVQHDGHYWDSAVGERRYCPGRLEVFSEWEPVNE